jgi:hypothetical protein
MAWTLFALLSLIVSHLNAFQNPILSVKKKIPISSKLVYENNVYSRTRTDDMTLKASKEQISISKRLFQSLLAISVPFLLTSGFHTNAVTYPIVGSNEIMKTKTHGTSDRTVQSKLRWNCDISLADRICNFNRNWAEFAGYFTTTTFLKEASLESQQGPVTFYDSVTGVPLFKAPIGRSFDDFQQESLVHGWPSFRDNEVSNRNFLIARRIVLFYFYFLLL